MIRLSENILGEIAKRIGVSQENLVYLAGGREDSDGTIYTYTQAGKKRILKVTAKNNENEVKQLMQKLEFARYIGEQGVPVAFPVADGNGEIFQKLEAGKYIILASQMDFVPGQELKTEAIDAQVAKEWGQITGAMHAATKKYFYWKNFPDSKGQWGHEEELMMFHKMCRSPFVKEKWDEMRHKLSGISKTRDNYGMIHNDNHQRNIMQEKGKLTVIDFDCANCHYFHTDILLPIQGMLFDKTGGLDRPLEDRDSISRFYEQFLAGYEQYNHVENEWLEQLDIFLEYRRLLLYTVMQDWMEQDANVRNHFEHMMDKEVKLFR